MALARLRADLENLVQSMYKEGVLDNQFSQIQAFQDESNPKFVVEVITLFCDDAERILRELTNHLERRHARIMEDDAKMSKERRAKIREGGFAKLSEKGDA